MKHWIKENWFKLLVSLGVLAIAGSFIYYFVVFVPKQKQVELDFKKQNLLDEQTQRDSQNELLQSCLIDAEVSYRDLIEVNSNSQGRYNSLDSQKYVESKYENDKASCFKQYPAK